MPCMCGDSECWSCGTLQGTRTQPKPSNLVTFACMIMTDGKRTVIGVYRGRMRNKNGKQSISFKTAQQIASVEVTSGSHLENCRDLENQYSTPEFPPVQWS